MTGESDGRTDGRASRASERPMLGRAPLPSPSFSLSLSPSSPSSVRRSTSFTFQESSYDVVDVQFVGLSHRAGVSCASRISRVAPYYRDDRRSTKILSLVCRTTRDRTRGFVQVIHNGRPNNRAVRALHSLSRPCSPLLTSLHAIPPYLPPSSVSARFSSIAVDNAASPRSRLYRTRSICCTRLCRRRIF